MYDLCWDFVQKVSTPTPPLRLPKIMHACKILAYFGPFWLFCHKVMHFLVSFYRPKQCGGVSKLTNLRYEVCSDESHFVVPCLPPLSIMILTLLIQPRVDSHCWTTNGFVCLNVLLIWDSKDSLVPSRDHHSEPQNLVTSLTVLQRLMRQG